MAINFVVATSLGSGVGGIGNIDTASLGMNDGDVCRTYTSMGEYIHVLTDGTATLTSPVEIPAIPSTKHWKLQTFIRGELYEDLTIYVNGGTGSDTTGDGTSGSPYATIGKAISACPLTLVDADLRVDVAAGTYNEDVVVPKFTTLGSSTFEFIFAKTVVETGTLSAANGWTFKHDALEVHLETNKLQGKDYKFDFQNTDGVAYYFHDTTTDLYGIVKDHDDSNLFVYGLNSYTISDSYEIYTPAVKIDRLQIYAIECQIKNVQVGTINFFGSNPKIFGSTIGAASDGSRYNALAGRSFSHFDGTSFNKIVGCYLKVQSVYISGSATQFWGCFVHMTGTFTIIDHSSTIIRYGTIIIKDGVTGNAVDISKNSTFNPESGQSFPSMTSKIAGGNYAVNGSFNSVFNSNEFYNWGLVEADGTASISGNALTGSAGQYADIDPLTHDYCVIKLANAATYPQNQTGYTEVVSKSGDVLTLADGSQIGNGSHYQVRRICETYTGVFDSINVDTSSTDLGA